MRVLVTGGCGFIGSALLRLLHARGHEVVNLDALTYCGFRHNSEGFEHSFVHGDVCDGSTVRGALEGVEVIFHLAAESHVDRSNVDPAPFVRTNLLGTQVLCSAALAAGVRRFVHVSTDEVYGSIDEGSFTEHSPLNPTNPYAASKAGSDLLVLAANKTHGLPAIVTRCTNNFGPRQYPEKLIPLAITRLLAGEPVPVYGDGQQVRDWIHVEDHARALVSLAERGSPGEIYNIGAHNTRTNLSVVEELCDHLGGSWVSVPDRPAHDRRYALDASKLAALGFEAPARDLSSTVEWFVERSLPG
ncbi:MAG TPA: dTDP-glucose 4,6-dehydratase [Myxococcota bacterium]|nr:dTDP-glucose 4,6-dehydratase [Myxococcota bacterium]